MSIAKISATVLVLAGLTTAAFAESDDNQASTNVLKVIPGSGVSASEAYASVPGVARRVTVYPSAQYGAYPQNGALPTQTNN